ncbi:MAG: iron-containing alcohol dehydrogenase [Spirochaetales bacterium]|nr:iron-containing alcohol dehydrogenase [Spirochaetales bacterium]
MDSFIFQNATKIVFGKGVETQVGSLTAEKSHKILLHWGRGSAKRSGLLDRVKSSLSASGVTWIELGGVQPNPRLSLVQEGIRLCREQQLDFVLAVGGGSVIDSAKAIAAGVPYAGNVWDFYLGKAVPSRALPVGCVLTIPAAGSESSGSSVITNEDGLLKKGLTCNDHLRPVFSLLNPELTVTLSVKDTAIGAADIMSHLMERYFTNSMHVDFSDRLLEATMQSVIHNLPRVLNDPQNEEARAELMWTGTLAHNDLFGMGRVGDWASHDIEHELSAQYDLPHGAGLAIVFPAWMKYVYRHEISRFAQWAHRVWGVEADFRTPELTALEGIHRLEKFYQQAGLPTRLSEVAVNDKYFDVMAAKATSSDQKTVGQFVKLDQKAIQAIFKLAQ